MNLRVIALLATLAAPLFAGLGGCSSVAYDDGYYNNHHSYSHYYPDRYQRDYYRRPYYRQPVYVAPAPREAVIVRPDGGRSFVYERY